MADNLTRAQRSMTMSRIRSRNTLPEMILRRLLHGAGLRFRLHVSTLAGKPDLVFQSSRVVVFIDGDFWHGWRFSVWQSKLAPYWRQKIADNRARDVRNIRRLRRQGWLVIRIWEHQVERDAQACLERVVAAIQSSEARTIRTPSLDRVVVNGRTGEHKALYGRVPTAAHESSLKRRKSQRPK